ncbi:MAG: MFS transporter [Spirochaetia bacterium]|jgi:predicted MFS family arabinose efflux permease
MRWVESWYISYALLGAAAAGILPILLPVVVAQTSGASQIGLVMAAFSFGGLTAPVWGRLADARRLHKALLAGGLACTAAASAVFPFTRDFSVRIALALLQGTGIAAAATTANLFIVEVHPRSEWDSRIGWLQTFYGGGQVVGLLVAGFLAQGGSRAGMAAAGALAAVAILPALLATPRVASQPVLRRPALTHAARNAEWPAGSPQRMYHHATGRALGLLGSSGGASFGIFLLGWFLSFAGSAAFFSLYPIVMQKTYSVGPALSSAGFAVSAGLGLFLYAPAGRWSSSGQPRVVLRIGMAVRMAAYALLWFLALSRRPEAGWPALGLFFIVVLAWSALSVASTAFVAEMYAQGGSEGEGLGLFNAVTALAGVAGAAGGGWAAGARGYEAVPVVALAGTGVGLALLLAVRSGSAKKRGSSHQSH